MRTDKWVYALLHLNLNDQDHGPTCHGTYAELSDGWRGDKPLPSEADLEAANQAVVDKIANEKYKGDRREAYGNIGDQMDMQYWDGVNDTTVWVDHVATVKSANPKP
jgi:hypothetical protein